MNNTIEENYNNLSKKVLIPPLIFLVLIVLFLFSQNALNAKNYTGFQTELFYFLNAKLAQFPNLQYNLTQLGDAVVILSFFTIFIVYASKIWQSFFVSMIISVIFSKSLKEYFCVPRPASFLDHSTFFIIGEAHTGPTSSLPSGHSITVFTILTIVMFSFLPLKIYKRIFWLGGFILLGLLVAFSRVGVGAHFPFDVMIGSIIGYFCGVFGILIIRNYNPKVNISLHKIYPIFILLFIGCLYHLFQRIQKENHVIIYYFSFISILYTVYVISKKYFQK